MILLVLLSTIENGLISVEIGIDNTNGVYSVYEFGTRLMRLPKQESINFLKDIVLKPGSYASAANCHP